MCPLTMERIHTLFQGLHTHTFPIHFQLHTNLFVPVFVLHKSYVLHARALWLEISSLATHPKKCQKIYMREPISFLPRQSHLLVLLFLCVCAPRTQVSIYIFLYIYTCSVMSPCGGGTFSSSPSLFYVHRVFFIDCRLCNEKL